MAKAILEFTLPEEQSEFTLAKNGGKYYCILCDIWNVIRSHNKHGVTLKDSWDKVVEEMSEFDMDEVS